MVVGEEVLILPAGDRGQPGHTMRLSAQHLRPHPGRQPGPSPLPTLLTHRGQRTLTLSWWSQGRGWWALAGAWEGLLLFPPSLSPTHCPQCPSELGRRPWPRTWTVRSEASSLRPAGFSSFPGKQEVASPALALPSL